MDYLRIIVQDNETEMSRITAYQKKKKRTFNPSLSPEQRKALVEYKKWLAYSLRCEYMDRQREFWLFQR